MTIVGAIAVPHPPLIVPSVGRGEERAINATIRAYEEASRALIAWQPDCLVVTSPHAPLFRDAFHVTTDAELRGSMARFGAPQERIVAKCDVELAGRIEALAAAAGIPMVDSERYREEMDHATYVPLYFLRKEYRATGAEAQGDLPWPIVRIGLSGMSFEDHRRLGRLVAQAADQMGRRVAIVASGDLSHKLLAEGPYGFAPEGPQFDARIGQIFESGELDALFDFDELFCDAAAECGLRSFQIMVGALDGRRTQSRLLSNEGPFGVGYAVAVIDVVQDAGCETSNEGADPVVALARASVEHYVRTGRALSLDPSLPAELLGPSSGVFVSLHEHGQLRGCIGTIVACAECLGAEIVQNGISACSRDPRFEPVAEEELDYLEYSVDVLGEAEEVRNLDELDCARYGVIVTKGYRRGLLLPNLEGVDTVAEQLSIAKRKAGIDPFDDDVVIERFEVVRHTTGGEPRRRV